MPRNVARLLHRPCAASQRPSPIPPRTLRPYTSYQPPRALSDETAGSILRVADQHSLRDTKIHAAKFIASINKLQAATSSIPTSIRHPDIRHPYTFGFIREKVQNTTPRLAQDAIAAVENVRAHLTDLQTEGYKDKKDGKTAMRELEREIEKWDDEKKRDTLKTWRLEEEARLIRLNESSQRLVNFVEEVLRRGGAKMKEPKRPEFGGGESSSKEVAKTEGERKSVKVEAEKKPAANSTAQSMGLADLQKQLEGKINRAREDKS